MRWASALSSKERTDEAIVEAAVGLRRSLAGARPDLVIAFASPHHLDVSTRIPAKPIVDPAIPGAA